MARKSSTTKKQKSVKSLTHKKSARRKIPEAEHQQHADEKIVSELKVVFQRRNRDLDPQLVWRGKDDPDSPDFSVSAPPIYIQEKVHPKAIIDDLMRKAVKDKSQFSLFADVYETCTDRQKAGFYQHDQSWTNRMILGDSLQVMASLTEREELRGKVQCIFMDPPYGIRFNSNFQWTTTSRIVQDGKLGHITNEPEQVKAFRDTWQDGVHSYLGYLRDRISVAHDLLTDSGSIFVQIGDENVHRVRAVIDEIFGPANFISLIAFKKTSPLGATGLPSIADYIIWFAKDKSLVKRRDLFQKKQLGAGTGFTWIQDPSTQKRRMNTKERQDPNNIKNGYRPFSAQDLGSSGYTKTCYFDINFNGRTYPPKKKSWRTNLEGVNRLIKADRLIVPKNLPYFVYFFDDFNVQTLHNLWNDTSAATNPDYTVQTSTKVVERCILMSTDPSDLVVDPTCGSGTSAYVAEQWGRRWITIDTSRVALALARARIMAARYPYYILADSRDGQKKEAELSQAVPSSQTTHEDIRHGFVYERIPHVTLKSISHNAEIDVIWEKFQSKLDPLRKKLNTTLRKKWAEWDIPYEADPEWSANVRSIHAQWLNTRVARQQEIDASIAANADFENLYDKPYVNNSIVRVAGPFTVESLSPHRTLGVDENDEIVDPASSPAAKSMDRANFTSIILDNLRVAGVQQPQKKDKIVFTSLSPWPGGKLIAGEGFYEESASSRSISREKRAAIFIGPEFGTLNRINLSDAAKEAEHSKFDVLIACAFNYDAHSSELKSLGKIPILKARMNTDLHMARDLRNTGKGNLFIIFGEPDIEIEKMKNDAVRIRIRGIDIFDPSTGKVRQDDTDGIACWFVDTDYNGKSFFVRQAYFLGAKDPYKSLRTSLKNEINEEAWLSLKSNVSRPFPKPSSGRVAVKAINHLGDEVLKILRVE